MKTIYLKNICGAEVLSRSNARKLYSMIDDETTAINLNGVSFLSRSVADELCNICDQFPSIKLLESSEDVEAMLDIVRKGRKSRREYASKARISITYNCRTMDDLKKALLTFGQ